METKSPDDEAGTQAFHDPSALIAFGEDVGEQKRYDESVQPLDPH
jgi:hypothetical protein